MNSGYVKAFRPFLFPYMALVELLLLAVGWILAILHRPTEERIVIIGESLPDFEWYFEHFRG